MTDHGPFHRKASVEAERFLVVAPQLPSLGARWNNCGEALAEIAQAAAREFSGDLNRVYLTGFSFGGNGALEIGSQAPEKWAAIWAVDPTQVPESPSMRPVWVSSGERARPNARQLKGKLKLTTLGKSRQRKFVYDPIHLSHAETSWEAYAVPRTYQWLLHYSLPKGRRKRPAFKRRRPRSAPATGRPSRRR